LSEGEQRYPFHRASTRNDGGEGLSLCLKALKTMRRSGVKSSSKLRCLQNQAPQKKHKLKALAGKHEFQKTLQEALQHRAM
jgi:DNA polymerase III epsilon subunit-like protein